MKTKNDAPYAENTQPLLDTLNEEQSAAVTHTEGPLLVIAGAGSGKTRVITTRIAHLIKNKGIYSSSIIALTFTNKAALEMKQRVQRLLGSTYTVPFIGTFHAYCLKLLKEYRYKNGLPPFTLVDDDDQKKLINSLITKHDVSKYVSAKQVLYTASQLKNNVRYATNTIDTAGINPFIYQIFLAYEAEKKASHCFDFDDLLLETLAIFNKDEAFGLLFQERVRHVLVDEYQDTNTVQHALLCAMTKRDKAFVAHSLCAVGDEDQSIYSWRGATVANILHFSKDFPGTSVVTIEQNYRSVQPILDIANHIIQNNKRRNPKTLWSSRQGTDRVRGITCVSEYQEADAVAQLIQTTRAQKPAYTIAILYRTHSQSRALEEGMLKNSIPYRIIGDVEFYKRKEIRDLLAYLRLILNPYDRPSLLRIINVPGRGFGAKFEELFIEHWRQEPLLSFVEIAQALITQGLVTGIKQRELIAFITLFKPYAPTDSPSKTLQALLQTTAYGEYLKHTYDELDAKNRFENIRELMNAIKHFEANGLTTIEQFLHEVSLMQEKMDNTNQQEHQVSLMTLHAAKGLEFDLVILAGVEETILPSSRSLMEDDGIEEERRLFYVGITRAKERLLITQTKYRYTYGQMTDQMPSRFLREIPGRMLTFYDGCYWQKHEFKEFFGQWFIPSATKSAAKEATITPVTKPIRAAQAFTNPPSPDWTTQSTSASVQTSAWKKNQPVTHAKFGLGTVQSSETGDEEQLFVTAKFKSGTKKIDARFLQQV